MDAFVDLYNQSGFAHLTIGNWIMFMIAGVLVYLAITKEYEPLLLIPISFGMVLANFPLADLGSYGDGIIGIIYEKGIKNNHFCINKENMIPTPKLVKNPPIEITDTLNRALQTGAIAWRVENGRKHLRWVDTL